MNVKNVLMTLVAVFCANLAVAQHPVLKKYADKPEVKRVYVSEDMMKMVNESMKSMWTSQFGLEKSPMTMTTFELVSLSGDEKDSFVSRDLKKVVTKKHKELVEASSGTMGVKIYGIGEKPHLSEMVLILTKDDTFTIMVMNGDINFDEMAKLGPKMMEKMPQMSGMPGMPAMPK